ncbi:SseB family protein, partial [Litorisediminicola beolgyonensis]
PGAEAALARAVNEALVFSGVEAGALDVTFVADSDPLAARLARVGLRFDLPIPEEPQERAAPSAPGSDPSKPPKLR